jgi:hypothetical protein
MILEIILLAMAALGIYEGLRLSKTVLLFTDTVGPGWYLFVMSCLLFVCAIALLVQKLSSRKTARDEVSLPLLKGAAGQALVLMMLYGIAILFLGYVISSAIFFILVQRVFGERSWIRCSVIGVAVTGCFYFVFSYLAGLPLP